MTNSKTDVVIIYHFQKEMRAKDLSDGIFS